MLGREQQRGHHVGDVHDREGVVAGHGVQRDGARRQPEDAQEVRSRWPYTAPDARS
jgi:hypothetical protein